MTFGQKVRHCREALQLTQTELAEKIQTCQSYVSKLESDKFNPSSQMIVVIASILGTSTDYLLIDDKKAG